MNITLRQIRYLLAVAEHGHFGRAAEAVHVTQPALSMQIKALETEIGQPVFERGAAGALLTPQGRIVADYGQRIMAELNALDRDLHGPDRRAPLTVGMIPTVAPYLLPDVLPALRQADIRRDLRLREAQTATLLAELSAGRLDAAVIATPEENDHFTGTALFADPFLLAGSESRIAALRAASPPPLPESLDPDLLLLLDEGHCLGDQALAACKLTRRTGRLDLGAASLTTLCRLAAQGMGLTFLPALALIPECAAAPELRLYPFPTDPPQREIRLIRRRATPPGDWFDELAAVLRRSGQAILAKSGIGAPGAAD